MFWSRRSKPISFGRTWSKHRCFGRMGRNVSLLVEPGRNIEVCDRADRNKFRSVEPSRNIEFRGRADRNISRLVKLSPNPVVLVAPVKPYLARSKHRCCCRAGPNVSRLVELAGNLDVLVAPVETYLAWANLVET